MEASRVSEAKSVSVQFVVRVDLDLLTLVLLYQAAFHVDSNEVLRFGRIQ